MNLFKSFGSLSLLLSLANAELNHPVNQQEISYIHVLFDWDQEPDAIGYNLQVSNMQQDIILDIESQTPLYIENTGQFNWDKSYLWRVRPKYIDESFGQWIDTLMFKIKESVDINLDIDILNDELIQDGLYMYSQWIPFTATVVIDKYGNEIWNNQDLFMNHVNQYGQLFGFNLIGIEFNYNNENIWTTPIEYTMDSHEFKQIKNGNYMGLDRVVQTGVIHPGEWTPLFQNLGYTADGLTEEYPWFAQRIVEFDKDTKEEIWSWNPFEHFSTNDYDVYGGTWWNALNGWLTAGNYDWLHTNAFDFDLEESAIYVSFCHLSRITKIDYPTGEVIWNIGLPSQYNTGSENICTELQFSWQHHIQVLDNGDLLFFDNGNLSEMLLDDPFPTTRIRRVRVIDESYCETIWQYDLPHNLHGSGTGSVQLLQNGNYYIYTHGNGLDENELSILEVTPEGEIVWKATTTNLFTAWYRSYKIPTLHPNAFSVIMDRYNTLDTGIDTLIGIILDDLNSSISFTIKNHSGYSQPYVYNLNDTEEWFGIISDTIIIEPFNQFTINLNPDILFDSTTSLYLDVWPSHHDYALKSFEYNAYHISNILNTNKKDILNAFSMEKILPNPFNPVATISFTIPFSANVNLDVYDILGNRVATLLKQYYLDDGHHSLKWDAQDFPSGLYFIRMESDGFMRTQKAMLLK